MGQGMVDSSNQKPLGVIVTAGIFILGIPTTIVWFFLLPNQQLTFPEALIDSAIIALIAIVLAYSVFNWEKSRPKGWKRLLPTIILSVLLVVVIAFQLNYSNLSNIFGNQKTPATDNEISDNSPVAGLSDQSDNANNDSPAVGSIYQFGGLDWRVLDVKDGKALLITEDIVEKRAYNDEFVDVTWETCSLRNYLNGNFLRAHFSAEEQGRIALTTVANNDNAQYGTPGGNDTQDKLFLLSIEEANSYFADKADRVAKYNGPDYWWWLRSPGNYASYAAYVSNDGGVGAGGDDVNRVNNGVRPALWLNL